MRRGGQQGSFLGMDAARPFSLNRWVHLGTTPQKDAGAFPRLFGVCETKKNHLECWNSVSDSGDDWISCRFYESSNSSVMCMCMPVSKCLMVYISEYFTATSLRF